jgi:hypothetical protein
MTLAEQARELILRGNTRLRGRDFAGAVALYNGVARRTLGELAGADTDCGEALLLSPQSAAAHVQKGAVSSDGVGTATVNVGSNGDAFGVANNSTMSVLGLLLATDAQAVNGVLYSGNTTRRNEANSIFSAVNYAGDIG